ncbi:hypothetical protein F4V58_00390 [Corynebacterium phocae]|uniref:hypothetical protein n=1 Tax=Corynebacterium phocae TaxID=161895 RepID=UPI00123A6E13|nr:hypothetical protein [Corynebacterium phocae]KAA8728617.1 hypothetical protein F4V58_00390 [Corynebacterium phocae]
MGGNSDDIAALKQRIDYLSAQVERLVELQSSYPSPMTTFRKSAMLAALTFEQEALARKLLGAVHAFNNGEKVDINQGLLPFHEETVGLFNKYADRGEINSEEVKDMLKTFIPGGDGAAQRLLEAWEIVQSQTSTK